MGVVHYIEREFKAMIRTPCGVCAYKFGMPRGGRAPRGTCDPSDVTDKPRKVTCGLCRRSLGTELTQLKIDALAEVYAKPVSREQAIKALQQFDAARAKIRTAAAAAVRKGPNQKQRDDFMELWVIASLVAQARVLRFMELNDPHDIWRRQGEFNTLVPREKIKGRRRPTMDEQERGIGRPLWRKSW